MPLAVSPVTVGDTPAVVSSVGAVFALHYKNDDPVVAVVNKGRLLSPGTINRVAISLETVRQKLSPS